MLFAHSLRPAPPLLIFMAENMRRRRASHKKRSSSILSATCLASSSLSVELPPLRSGDIFVLGGGHQRLRGSWPRHSRRWAAAGMAVVAGRRNIPQQLIIAPIIFTGCGTSVRSRSAVERIPAVVTALEVRRWCMIACALKLLSAAVKQLSQE